jgi:hypothetical protein
MPAQVKKKVARPKKVVKPRKTAKQKTLAKKQPALECGVCGYRVVVERECGCAHEHAIVCCGKPMRKKKA